MSSMVDVIIAQQGLTNHETRGLDGELPSVQPASTHADNDCAKFMKVISTARTHEPTKSGAAALNGVAFRWLAHREPPAAPVRHWRSRPSVIFDREMVSAARKTYAN